MDVTTGSMGSVFRTLRVPPSEIPFMAGIDWNTIARRVLVDPVTGLIELMSPSGLHEGYAHGTNIAVGKIGDAFGIRYAARGATRWKRRPDDPPNSGSEPDACFWIGPSADAWTRACDDGPEAQDAFEAATPPDLVIEVERNSDNPDKPIIYREIGATEMWRLDVGRDRTLHAEILDLQHSDGPETRRDASAVLPLCTPEFIRDAVELAYRARGDELGILIDEARREAEAGTDETPQP